MKSECHFHFMKTSEVLALNPTKSNPKLCGLRWVDFLQPILFGGLGGLSANPARAYPCPSINRQTIKRKIA